MILANKGKWEGEDHTNMNLTRLEQVEEERKNVSTEWLVHPYIVCVGWGGEGETREGDIFRYVCAVVGCSS